LTQLFFFRFEFDLLVTDATFQAFRLDLRGSIPTFVAITTGKVNGVKLQDKMRVQEDAIYTMDRGYVDADQVITLVMKKSKKGYPERFRRVSYVDKERNKQLVCLTNNFDMPAKTVADAYKQWWHVELFFRWIMQHLQFKKFYGTTNNAVKSQIWVGFY